jgi:hypothetical protein
MATPKKVIYFVAGAALNTQEKAQLAYLNGSLDPVYNVAVRSCVGNMAYSGTDAQSHNDPGSPPEPCDFIAYSDAAAGVLGGNASLYAYLLALLGAGSALLTLPTGSGALAIIVTPTNPTFAHAGTYQMSAVIKKQDGTLHDVTTDSGTTWSMQNGSIITVGAHTGIVSATGAGSDTVSASYSPGVGSSISSASQPITAT